MSLTDDVTIATDVEIDLNGYSIRAGTYDINVPDGFSLTITGNNTNGSTASNVAFSQTGHLASTGSDSNITLENIYIYTTGSANTGYGVVQTGGTLTMENVTLNSTYTYGALLATGATATITDCTSNGTFYFIKADSGADVTLESSTILSYYNVVYLANSESGTTHTLDISDCTLTSVQRSPIEVVKTDITVSETTLVSNATTQSYTLSSSDSGGIGFGVVLAGYESGTAYEGEVSLSDITYTLKATADPDGGDTPWNVCYYGSDGASEYEEDGASE